MSTVTNLDTDYAPAVPGSTQQSSNVNSLDSNSRTTYTVCSSIVGHKAFTCCSVGCGESAHQSCLVSKYKNSGSTALRNSLEWLQGFIQQSSLHYSCPRYADSFNFSEKSIASVHRKSRSENYDISSGTFNTEV